MFLTTAIRVLSTAGLCALLALVPGCRRSPESPSDSAGASGKLSVFVSVLPQVYFVERVGGARVRIEVFVPPGQSPATYAPTPRQMARLSDARVFFRVGVPFENVLVPRIERMMGDLLVVDTRDGIQLRRLDEHHHDEDEEHPDHGEEMDPHTWMSPLLVKQQARTIRDTLMHYRPMLFALWPYRVTGVRVGVEPASVRAGRPVAYSVRLDCSATAGDHVVRLEVFGPGGTACEWHNGNRLAVGGKLAGSFRTALDAPKGSYRIVVRDVATGCQGAAVFAVQ